MTPTEAIMGLRDLFGRARVSVWRGEDGALHMRGAPEATVTEFGGHRVVVEDRAPAADPLKAQIEAGTKRIQSATVIVRALAEGAEAKAALKRHSMARPSHISDRLKALTAQIAAESDKLAEEIDVVAKTEVPAAFDEGRAFLSARRAEVRELRAELATMTNLPLDGSQESSS